jgi:hypothetical protein
MGEPTGTLFAGCHPKQKHRFPAESESSSLTQAVPSQIFLVKKVKDLSCHRNHFLAENGRGQLNIQALRPVSYGLLEAKA